MHHKTRQLTIKPVGLSRIRLYLGASQNKTTDYKARRAEPQPNFEFPSSKFTGFIIFIELCVSYSLKHLTKLGAVKVCRPHMLFLCLHGVCGPTKSFGESVKSSSCLRKVIC